MISIWMIEIKKGLIIIIDDNGARAGDTKPPNHSPHAYEGTDVNEKVNTSSESIIQHLQQIAFSSGRIQLPNAQELMNLKEISCNSLPCLESSHNHHNSNHIRSNKPVSCILFNNR